MTSGVVNNIDEIRELTIDELDQVGGGIFPLVLGAAFTVGYLVGFLGAWAYDQHQRGLW